MNGSPLDKEKRGFAKPRRIVHCALTVSQFELLQDMALYNKMNISEYIRFKLFDKK